MEVYVDPASPTLRNECNNPVLPGSAADLKLISALTSRLVIDYLQNNSSVTNHWIWYSELIENTPLTQPFSIKEQCFKPHQDCQFCNDYNTSTVYINEVVLNFMVEKVTAKAGIETGGVLVGYITESGEINITHASDAGPKAKETPVGFEKDIDYCQTYLDSLFTEFGDKAVYLGEWHSHPNESNTPSNTDLKSLTEISYQKDYLTDRPVMVIFNRLGAPSCTIHPVGKIFRKVELKIT